MRRTRCPFPCDPHDNEGRHTVTVGELRAKLFNLPDDLLVLGVDPDGEPIYQVTLVQVLTDEDHHSETSGKPVLGIWME